MKYNLFMKKSEFAPFNDSPKTNPEYGKIDGPYSTFDPELSKFAKLMPNNLPGKKAILAAASRKLSRNKLNKFHDYLVGTYIKILQSDDIITKMKSYSGMSNDDKLFFADDIVKRLIKQINTKHKIFSQLRVGYENNPKSESIAFFYHHKTEPDKSMLVFNVGNERSATSVTWFMASLFHEFVHAISSLAPHISPLGAQLKHLASKYGVSSDEDDDAYVTSPDEINAYASTRRLHLLIDAILDGTYAEKRDELHKEKLKIMQNTKIMD